jgi:hypothetical protein
MVPQNERVYETDFKGTVSAAMKAAVVENLPHIVVPKHEFSVCVEPKPVQKIR